LSSKFSVQATPRSEDRSLNTLNHLIAESRISSIIKDDILTSPSNSSAFAEVSGVERFTIANIMICFLKFMRAFASEFTAYATLTIPPFIYRASLNFRT
jgi:hypothetical protein